MANESAKGSIVLEILIVLLSAALVAVILIPGKIWKEEAREELQAHHNMTSIYEAEKYYKKLTGKFTTDPGQLIETIHADSNLIREQKVVNFTRKLMLKFDTYLHNDYIHNIIRIKRNIDQIYDDLESNRYNFRTIEDINNEANEIKVQLKEFLNTPEQPYFPVVLKYIDSLLDIRQTLTDYSLQVNALRIANVTDSLQKYLPLVNMTKLSISWAPLSDRIQKFIKTVKHSELVRVTSVADRVQDFKNNVDKAFKTLTDLDANAELSKLETYSKELDELYQEFLKNYNITSELALSKLPEADSLIIHLTEENFYSPVNHQMYKLLFENDSQFVKVESPVLLDDLKQRSMKVVDEINQLPFMNIMKDYLKMLDSVKTKTDLLRKKFRKNTDLFIAYKELEDLVGRYDNISVVTAYRDLEDFRTIVPKCQSYSTIKNLVENALKGVEIYDQAYTENTFGNLDSLQIKVKAKLDEVNGIIEKINKRRRRNKIVGLTPEQQALDSLYNAFRNAKNDAMLSKLKEMEKELKDIFIFAQKGKKIRVYGVFDKKIKNFGYIFKDVKSWEEKNK